MKFEIYCDGSTRGNGQENAVGAWAWLLLADGKEVSRACQAEKNTTNQRMELTAAADALEVVFADFACPFDRVIVYTDSAYLHNCYKQKWYTGWENNGWKNSKKQPVANRDLWERLIPFFGQPEVEFVKVKGHAGNHYNEIVDTMAQNASTKLKESLNENNSN